MLAYIHWEAAIIKNIIPWEEINHNLFLQKLKNA